MFLVYSGFALGLAKNNVRENFDNDIWLLTGKVVASGCIGDADWLNVVLEDISLQFLTICLEKSLHPYSFSLCPIFIF